MNRRSMVIGAGVCAAGLLIAIAGSAGAQTGLPEGSPQGRRGPVYQRHAYGAFGMEDGWRGARGHRRGHHVVIASPQIQAGWFQRPYPYHLDFYRMRNGGSYAPYFGNLYGPPQVVTAPPYYGPYYGGWDYGYMGGYSPAPGGYGPAGPYQGGPADAELKPVD